jgi:hypothetical protein
MYWYIEVEELMAQQQLREVDPCHPVWIPWFVAAHKWIVDSSPTYGKCMQCKDAIMLCSLKITTKSIVIIMN